MAPEAMHGLIRAGLLSHLQGALAGWEGPIGCEHSSGIDSIEVLGGAWCAARGWYRCASTPGATRAAVRGRCWSNSGRSMASARSR